MVSATAVHDVISLAPYWAALLKEQLELVEPYVSTKDIPPTINVNEKIFDAPQRHSTDPAAARLAKEIAALMYPGPKRRDLFPNMQYERDVSRLRAIVDVQRTLNVEERTREHSKMRWAPRIAKQGAWNPASDPVSYSGASALPMPVKIADPESLAPFFQHLALRGNAETDPSLESMSYVPALEPYYQTEALEFEKGVVYSDKRMDLCKMVLGPDNIDALMESLRNNDFVTHFLLGNNIIGPRGADCIAKFINEFPDRMDTWYLAGNCIDAPSFGALVDQWLKSASTTNIWLKRNPLGCASAHNVFRLIAQTAHLRTLDLDQTELGDESVYQLFTKLEAHNEPISLRHIYLNAVGIGERGASAIANYLKSPQCSLDSLYMNNNPLGDAGVTALALGLKSNTSLTRLTLASTGVSDDGIIALCTKLEKHPHLRTLDIGQSYATEDLKMRYNWITDRSASAIHNLITVSPHLTYLNIAQCAMTHLGLNTVLDAVTTSDALLFYRASTIWPQSRAPSAVRAGQQHVKMAEVARATLAKNVKRVYGENVDYEQFMKNEKRWLVSDQTDVRKIDSVYRNRDSGLARRGLKRLDKWWDEDDDTLEKVMGAVGPVCITRKEDGMQTQ